MTETSNTSAWGRVDDDRNVYVREGDQERLVGSFPDGTPDEAIAYFTRKYDDLDGQITLLEARVARDSAEVSVVDTVSKLQAQLEAPAAVGDIAALRARVEKLAGKASELSEQHRAEKEAAREEALAKREGIAVEAERLAAQPEEQIRWKDTSQDFERLFGEWQAAQKNGPQIPKSQADALWKRFRAARQTFDSARRAHFAQLDASNKDVKQRKERIIAAAEALAPKGAEGIPAYRSLLDEWKAAGRASRKIDDQLWARFKAAGDVLFEAKAAEVAQTNEEYSANLAAKNELLDGAASLLDEHDHSKARKRLTEVQLKWDEIGRVPREALRAVEDRLRALENHVKNLEDEHWRKTNPETKARSEGLRGQLEDSIAELASKLEAAKSNGDENAAAEAESALETQRSWLAALGD